MIRRTLSILMLVALFGCGRAYVIHPGAVNTFDSQTYDVLIAAKTSIDNARVQFTNKTLPDSMKPTVNELVKAYDVAYAAYLTYHDAISTGKTSDQYLAALQKDMTDVTTAMTKFKGGK